MNINFANVQEEKEMYAVLSAKVINGKTVDSELVSLYDTMDELKKDRKNLNVDGHKTAVKVKVTIEPEEYLGDVTTL